MRTKLGLLVTVSWFVVIAVLGLTGKLGSFVGLTPNTVGDFLAGMMAPVAFLWLILGYYQQGQELKQNTKALMLQEQALSQQAEELQESVEQQRRLVEVTQRQVAITEQTLRLERVKLTKISQMKLRIGASQVNKISSGMRVLFHLTNTGHTVTSVRLAPVGDFSIEPLFISIFDFNHEVQFTLLCKETTLEGVVQFSYVDGLHEHRTQDLKVNLRDNGIMLSPDPLCGVTEHIGAYSASEPKRDAA